MVRFRTIRKSAINPYYTDGLGTDAPWFGRLAPDGCVHLQLRRDGEVKIGDIIETSISIPITGISSPVGVGNNGMYPYFFPEACAGDAVMIDGSLKRRAWLKCWMYVPPEKALDLALPLALSHGLASVDTEIWTPQVAQRFWWLLG